MNKIIPYVILGYPSIKESVKMIKEMAAQKFIPYIEIGLPSMNPYHDGETISEAQKRNEVESIEEYFDVVESSFTRKETRKFICMGYMEDIERYGKKDFIKTFKDNGFSGLIVIGESKKSFDDFINEKVPVIPLISVGFDENELRKSLEIKQPFIYFVSGEGRTGEVKHFEKSDLRENICRIKKIEEKTEVFAGFGINNREKALEMIKTGFDGVIIGSAIVKKSDSLYEVFNLLNEIGCE